MSTLLGLDGSAKRWKSSQQTTSRSKQKGSSIHLFLPLKYHVFIWHVFIYFYLFLPLSSQSGVSLTFFAWYQDFTPYGSIWIHIAASAKKQMSSWLAVLVRSTKVVRLHNVQRLITWLRGCEDQIQGPGVKLPSNDSNSSLMFSKFINGANACNIGSIN
jgi:hypothetical protein